MDALLAPLIRLEDPVAPEELKRTKPVKVAKSFSRATPTPAGSVTPAPGADGSKAVPAVDDILSTILPPREVIINGKTMMQAVSSQPATRLDVIRLQEMLDNRLVQRQARERGLCQVRTQLYSDVFDELIRQVTTNSPERGLLLLRIRDELRMTLQAHKLQYQSAVAFGVRKTAIAEKGLPEMRDTIKKLEREKAELEAKVQELQTRCETIERNAQDERVIEEKRRKEETSYYQKTNTQLTTHLRTETEKVNTKK